MPNLTIGAPVVQSLRKHSDAFFDCHLMVTHPEQWVAVRVVVVVVWCVCWGCTQSTLSCTSRHRAPHCKLCLTLCCVCCMCCAVQDFAKAGAGGAGMMFTFHLEACADPASLSKDSAHPAVVGLAQKVRQAGMKVRPRACRRAAAAVRDSDPVQPGGCSSCWRCCC